MKPIILLLLLVAQTGLSHAQDATKTIQWDFASEETFPIVAHGGVHRDVPGPRPPEYPGFEKENTAVRFDGRGSYLAVEDQGKNSLYDFSNGDSITLEAWVHVDEIRPGEYVYIIGKGRTGRAGFARDNQNWALRLRENQGQIGVNFLFATPRSERQPRADSHWHRWSSKSGFKPGPNWHHVAVVYQFGKPESIKGWIDGKLLPGSWDMGGPTTESPVMDDDSIWIGSSQGGSVGNSLRGSVDSVAIHRSMIDDKVLSQRFRRTGAEKVHALAREVMPESGEISSGKVAVSFHEGFPAHDRWLYEHEKVPEPVMTFHAGSFLLDRLPQRFDEAGIRADWKAPVLVRFASEIPLESGKHSLIMRVRGLSRLWFDGKVIARSKPLGNSPNGEEAMTPPAKPPLPGLRAAEHRQQEIKAEIDVDKPGIYKIVLETIVGGKAFRTDPGETCLAIQTQDGKSYQLVAPTNSSDSNILLTDAGVNRVKERLEKELQQFDIQRRRVAAKTQETYWNQRHELARKWVAENPPPQVPRQGMHPVDAFLKERIEAVKAAQSRTPAEVARKFYAEVFPILRDECLRCHGDKIKGGLRLNSAESIVKAGDSELPAVVPGKPEESELIRRIRSEESEERMPPGSKPLKAEQVAVLEAWIRGGAQWPDMPISADQLEFSAIINDEAYIRRIFLDTVGVGPTEQDVKAFLNDSSSNKREKLVERLLNDERWADHWVSYWQDVLAENPTLINASLNTTGPFRWFIYDSLLDNKSFDRFVTELVQLKGSSHEGGSAGFGIAADNDAPMAAKGQIISGAFLGIELQCARCHDSPYHSTKQKDLYNLAAMFERKPVIVPKTSRVPKAFFENKMRESLIKATLNPDEPVEPVWPFGTVTGSQDDDRIKPLVENPKDSREKLAALITAPQNERFAKVIVNRVWKRLIGAGLVEPVDDWEGHAASHPELMDWLASEFVAHNYDLRHLNKVILTSEIYQREAVGKNLKAGPESRLFAAPDRRRLTAEQIVDSLYAGAGKEMDVEELTFDPDARRPSSNRLTLGVPNRAWMFASLANERDRPSLALPRARGVADILEAFGWSGSRQNPRTVRETDPHVLQPGVISNSIATELLTRVTENSGLAEIAKNSRSPQDVVDRIFLRLLGRYPTMKESQPFVRELSEGFQSRNRAERLTVDNEYQWEPLPRVTWSNHLRPEANSISTELERRSRIGGPPDGSLETEWREKLEDVVWSVINTTEFVWVP